MGNICIECEWVTNLRRTKKKEDEGAKYYVKLNPPMMNIYRQYFLFDFPLIHYIDYNIKIKVDEYAKLKLYKMNL